MVSLLDTVLMFPRELPSYFKTAFSHQDSDDQSQIQGKDSVGGVVKKTMSLIKELVNSGSSDGAIENTKKKLHIDFKKINQSKNDRGKPVCVYFVSTQDDNGAILGKRLYYYHHYKIENLQKYFFVAPKLVSSQKEMKKFMVSVRRKNGGKKINFVDIVAHGNQNSLVIHAPGKPSIVSEKLRKDLFSDCAEDATILLDSCMTGAGSNNIANTIARKTPGRTVLAPSSNMYFSKPIVSFDKNIPRVVAAVYGDTIIAKKCVSFSYSV